MPEPTRPTVNPKPEPSVQSGSQAKKTGLSPQSDVNVEAKKRYDRLMNKR